MFECKNCNYTSERPANYARHLRTQKHIQSRKIYPVVIADNQCEACYRVYKCRSGLWKHQQSCSDLTSSRQNADTQNQALIVYEKEDDEEKEDVNKKITMTDLLGVIRDLTKQNQEIKELLINQSQQLTEYANRPTVVHNHQQIQNQQIQNQNQQNNQHISFNVFLNEHCKGAINMNEFIHNLEISMEDVEMVGKIGFVEGISRIVLNELNRMDVYARPIHCTDTKRETIYIKDSDEWKRDTENKENTRRMIERVANKNLNKIPEWQREHPGVHIMNTKENDLSIQIMIQSLGGLGGTSEEKTAKNQEKIIKRLTKEVFMDKQQSVKTI
jgi:hypothetical protein